MINVEPETRKVSPFTITLPKVFILCFVVGATFSTISIVNKFNVGVSFAAVALTMLAGYLFVLFTLGDKYLHYTMMIPGVMIILAVTLLPILFLFYLSVHNVTLLNFNKTWEFVGLENFLYFFTQDKLFFPAFIRTVQYMLVVLVLQLVLGMGLALLLQKKFFGRSLVSSVLVIPVMASPIVIAMLWKYMFGSTNGFINLVLEALNLPTVNWLTNTPLPFVESIPVIGPFLVNHLNANIGFLSTVIVNVWQWTPFVFLMFLAGLSALPKEPYEAAKVDGASPWQTFWMITFPLMKPVIGVVVLIRVIDLMKVYDQIWALFGDSVVMRTLNIHIFSVGLSTQNYSRGAALSLIVLATVILMYTAFNWFSDWISRRGMEK